MFPDLINQKMNNVIYSPLSIDWQTLRCQYLLNAFDSFPSYSDDIWNLDNISALPSQTKTLWCMQEKNDSSL